MNTKAEGSECGFREIQRRIIAFRDARDWQQFHDPKNLAEAVAIEAGELLEHFLWTPSSESYERGAYRRDKVSEEAADILIYLTYLAEEVGFDLVESVAAKLRTNEAKYPVRKAKGRSEKYREL